jgi:hypothetical protein
MEDSNDSDIRVMRHCTARHGPTPRCATRISSRMSIRMVGSRPAGPGAGKDTDWTESTITESVSNHQKYRATRGVLTCDCFCSKIAGNVMAKLSWRCAGNSLIADSNPAIGS